MELQGYTHVVKELKEKLLEFEVAGETARAHQESQPPNLQDSSSFAGRSVTLDKMEITVGKLEAELGKVRRILVRWLETTLSLMDKSKHLKEIYPGKERELGQSCLRELTTHLPPMDRNNPWLQMRHLIHFVGEPLTEGLTFMSAVCECTLGELV